VVSAQLQTHLDVASSEWIVNYCYNLTMKIF